MDFKVFLKTFKNLKFELFRLPRYPYQRIHENNSLNSNTTTMQMVICFDRFGCVDYDSIRQVKCVVTGQSVSIIHLI